MICEIFMHANILQAKSFPKSYLKIREHFMHMNCPWPKFTKFSVNVIFMFYSIWGEGFPVCKSCGLESESVTHYLLRCPTFHAQRTVYLAGLLQTLDPTHIANLDDNLIVELFLYGDKKLSDNINLNLFTMAQTFITSSNRFDNRYLAR